METNTYGIPMAVLKKLKRNDGFILCNENVNLKYHTIETIEHGFTHEKSGKEYCKINKVCYLYDEFKGINFWIGKDGFKQYGVKIKIKPLGYYEWENWKLIQPSVGPIIDGVQY